MTNALLRSIGTAVLTVGCTVAIPGVAAAQTPAQPATLSGTWNMSLIGDHVIPTALVLEQNGTELKGTFILVGKDFPVTGEVRGGKFTLTGKGPASLGGRGNDHAADVAASTPVAKPERPSANAQVADMTITGTTDADGGLAGEFAAKVADRAGATKWKWTAERMKERKVPTQAVSSDSVNVTGSWKMTIPEAQLQMEVELKQVGARITGSAKSDHLGAMTLEGTFASGTLSFVTVGPNGPNGGQEIRIEYSGKYKADGTFAGDLSSQMGPMTWTAEREKK